jgi:hypothetical protein
MAFGLAEVTTVGRALNRIRVTVCAWPRRHARWREPAEAETAAAVAGLPPDLEA